MLGNIVRQWIKLHARIQPSKSKILASINFWTSIFKERQCSTSWSGAPWWKAQERLGWYRTGNSLGTRGGALVWRRFFWSRMGSSSAYVIGIGLNFILGACCRGCSWCWCSGLCCSWFCEATSETTRVLVSLTRPGALLSHHECSWISCSNWYVLSYCLHECCRCELTLDFWQSDNFWNGLTLYKKEKLVRLGFETMNAVWCMICLCKSGHLLYIEGLIKAIL